MINDIQAKAENAISKYVASLPKNEQPTDIYRAGMVAGWILGFSNYAKHVHKCKCAGGELGNPKNHSTKDTEFLLL